MAKVNQNEVSGLVRTEQKKGDRDREKPYTAIMNDGRRVRLDAGEASSLQKRLDKDRSRMERDGNRDKEREPERRERNPVASKEAQRAFIRNNFTKQS